MNDRELEAHVRDAFNSIEVPSEVKSQTLYYVMSLNPESSDTHCKKNTTIPAKSDETPHASNTTTPSSSEQIKPIPAKSTESDYYATKLSIHADQRSDTKASIKRPPRSRRRFWAPIAGSLAACLLLVATLFGASRIYLEPTAFVDIDINPSIQLKLNRFDQVIDAQGLNDDGRDILLKHDLKGLPYQDALNVLMSSESFAAYLNQDALMALSISSDNPEQEKAITDASESYLASTPYRATCNGVSRQLYDEAHNHNMGCGRYEAALELLELDPSLTIEDCSEMSMRELRDRINACKNGYIDSDESASAGTHQGSGYGYHGGQGAQSGQGGQSQGGHRRHHG